MSDRTQPPPRRNADVAQFEHRGVMCRALVTRGPDGKPIEMFLDIGRVGSDVHTAGHDLGVAVSLTLQHGCPLEILLHAFEKLADGSPAGPAGKALALLRDGQR